MAFGDTQQAAVDLTLVFDLAEVWPDPEACPDWPRRLMQTSQGLAVQGEASAREQLQRLQVHLARTDKLREPTADERASARRDHFRDLDQPQAGEWACIGLAGITYSNHVKESAARHIVEATHIRGYLRKLETRRARAGEIEADRERTRHQARLDRYERLAAQMQGELAGLAEAAARHQQRLDDEKAFDRATDLRRSLAGAYAEACTAARALGQDPPERPTA